VIRRTKKTLLYSVVFILTGFLIWMGVLLKDGPDATILMYHSIGETYAGNRSLGISLDTFSRQMAFFKRHGYRVIRLTDLVMKLEKGEPIALKTIVLTFDDGYEDNYTNVFPILKEYGFPATIFVVTDFIGREAPAYGQTARFLSVAMMKEMAASGLVDFGSHSASHVNLADAGGDPQVMQREVGASRRFLEGLLGRPVSLFCYPFGGHSQVVRRHVRDAGYAAAVTTNPRRGYVHDDLFALKRTKMDGTEGWLRIAFKTSGYYLKMKEMSQ